MVLHRYGSIAGELAGRLLLLREGDRMSPVGQLAADFGTGRGTVQAALQLLIREGAVELESRGRLGSFVRRLDSARLLERAGLSPIIGAMPVAYSARFQGLAAGLTRAFEQQGLPLILAQVRGAQNRLHFLRTGRSDFAITSRLAWQEEEGRGDLHQVLSFGPGSNVGDHVLLFADRSRQAIEDGMRVGIDPSSHDHRQLTLAECQGRSVTLVEVSYGQAIARLLAGEIDVTLWDAGVPIPGGGLALHPRRRRGPGVQPDTEAVLLVRADSGSLAALLADRIDPQLVRAVQEKVVAGQESPTF